MKKQAGFTLIEITVTVAIFTLMAFGIMALASNFLTAGTTQGTLLANTDQARKLAFRVAEEIRNAVTSSTGAYPLSQAGDQQITFFASTDGTATIRQVRYYTQNGKLYKGLITPTGNPLAYNPANEAVNVVQDNVANNATPLFYYYNDAYNGVSDTFLAQPVNVTQVRFVKMNLLITNVASKNNSNTYTVTTSAAMRNLKTNLGN